MGRKRFVIDCEAVVLSVDGISDFNALLSGRHNEDVQLCAFDVLAMNGDDLRGSLCPCTRPTRNACWLAGRMASSSASLNKARSDQTYSGKPASWDWRG